MTDLRCLRRFLAAGLAGICAGALSAQEVIVGAGFHHPTDTYRHCILGDCTTYTGLNILSETATGQRFSRSFTLQSDDHVYEDIAPRLWDVTGDGAPEVVVILTRVDAGAALAVYDLTGQIARTPHIGQPHRWLAPIGAADLDRDGRVELAFIDRPHLAKRLRVFEWDGTGLRLDAERGGLTNHRIGEDFITGGVRTCGTAPELVTVNADWSHIMVTTMDAGRETGVDTDSGAERLHSHPAGDFTHDRLADVMACR